MTDYALRTTRGKGLASITLMVVAMAVVLITSSSAFATTGANVTGGSGEETNFVPGDDFGTGSHPHCLEVTDSSYEVHMTGDFTVGVKTYTGPATLTYSTSTPYFVDETGTYTQASHPNGCVLNTLGSPIASTADLEGASGGDSISCSPSSADYNRNNGEAITVHFSGDCTAVHGSGNTASVSATFTGLLHACFGDTCDVSTISEGHLIYS